MPDLPVFFVPEVLLGLLRQHPDGVQVKECVAAVGGRRSYYGVYAALRQLCRLGLAVHVGYGRYALPTPRPREEG
jgi:hypothetical protein